jgi:hypothetical protein
MDNNPPKKFSAKEHMLSKGWNEGQGLGARGQGIRAPISSEGARYEREGLGIDLNSSSSYFVLNYYT